MLERFFLQSTKGVALSLLFLVCMTRGFISCSFLPRPCSTFRYNELFSLYSATSQNDRVIDAFAQTQTFNKSNRVLYPPATLQRNGTLNVDPIHAIYYAEYGKEKDNCTDGSAQNIALSLHGGPGAGSFPKHAQFFNPDKYHRIVLFDQRGCGRSTPLGETRSNSLEHLVEDIEKLRIHLSVEKFDVILGGSWGSTLALAYSQSFPEKVGSIVLRGVCLFRPEEINWLFGNEAWWAEDNKLDSDAKTHCISNRKELIETWKCYQETVQKSCRESEGIRRHLHEYYNHLLGTNVLARAIATKSWFTWEFGVSSSNNMSTDFQSGELFQNESDVISWEPAVQQWRGRDGNVAQETIESLRQWPQRAASKHDDSISSIIRPVASPKNELVNVVGNLTKVEAEKFVPAQAMLTCYYSVNDEYMMSKFHLLSKENIDKIRHIPCIAVQGARDLICPPDSALDLTIHFPEIECRIVTQGRHSMYDSFILSELIEATDRIADYKT